MSFPYPVYPLPYHVNNMRMLFEDAVNVFLRNFDEDEQPQYYLAYLYNSNATGFDFPPGMYREFRHFRRDLVNMLEHYVRVNGVSARLFLELCDYYESLDTTHVTNMHNRYVWADMHNRYVWADMHNRYVWADMHGFM